MFAVLRFGKLAVFLLSCLCGSLTPHLCKAQVPTVAPAEPDDDPPASRSESKTSHSSTVTAGTPGTDFFLSNAERYASEKNLNGVIGSLRSALEYHQSENWAPAMIHQVVLEYARALYDNKDFEICLHVVNALSKSHPKDLELANLRGASYEKLQWENAMLDQLRNTLHINPDLLPTRRFLAVNLVYSHVPSLRNVKEALFWLDTLENRVDEEPFTTRLIATAAADTGDFDRAMRLQKRFLESGELSSARRPQEEALLAIYQKKLEEPKPSQPTIDDRDLLDDAAIGKIACKSMIIVKVRGSFACIEEKTGQTHSRRISHDHIGTVLDTMGTFLVSSESVRLPQFEEIKELKGKGKTEWQQGPFIELFSLPENSKPGVAKESKLLGKARIVGLDPATGLGVIELERQSQYHFTGIGTVESPAKFMPAFRAFSPETKSKLAETFEVSVKASDEFKQPNLREFKGLELEPRVYDDFYAKNPMTSMLINLADDQSPIGTPLFNRLGECVGIRHQVDWFDKKKNVAIPAAVCTRVAAKLATYGEVPRMDCPFKIFPVTHPIPIATGETKKVMGIMVSETPVLPAYEGLNGKMIVSVDGAATPTLTEWLVALERANAIDLKSISIDVYDWRSDQRSTMVIPAREPAKATSLQSELKNQTVIDSRKAIELASQWIANNVHIDRGGLDDLIKKFDRMLRNQKNVACYFGSDVTKNGKFHSLFIRDGEVLTSELASRTVELMGLDKGKGSIMEFGDAIAKQDNTVELSQLKLGHKNEDQKFPEITVSADAIRRIGDQRNLSLRLQFVAPDKQPILIPLAIGPALNTKAPVTVTAPTKGEIDSLLTGGLLIVDVVASTGSPDKTGYRSVSNQLVDYAELLDAGFSEMFRKLNGFTEEKSAPTKR